MERIINEKFKIANGNELIMFEMKNNLVIFEYVKSKLLKNSIMKKEEMMRDKFTDYIVSIDPKERKAKILQLSAISIDDTILLNELGLFESNSILDKHGQKFIVKSGKIDRRKQKLGNCYPNAAKKMMDGYGYVEGYCINKNAGFKFGHAWNVDKDGTHLDFTLDNSEEFDYFGIVIPNDLVYKVGYRNGGVWYSVLPFIEEIELISFLQKT